VQEEEGCIDPASISHIADSLHLPRARADAGHVPQALAGARPGL
jgi:NADH:ubiquinone oxidoreductase subunit E